MTKIKELVKYKHPNSRKTNALAKQIQKAKSREKSKQHGNIKMNLIGEKLMWFKNNLEIAADCTLCTPKQALELIEKYLLRFEEELEQIKIKHSISNRKNRQHASREDIINMTVKAEKEEFNTCGLEIPDLLNAVQFKMLKEWDGELRFLPKFKLKRYSRKYLEGQLSESVTESTNSQESTQSSQIVDMDVI